MAADNRFFDTAAGGIDVWNQMKGVPSWKEARPRAIEAEAFGNLVPVLDKDSLVAGKLAAGRDEDLADIADLAQMRAHLIREGIGLDPAATWPSPSIDASSPGKTQSTDTPPSPND